MPPLCCLQFPPVQIVSAAIEVPDFAVTIPCCLDPSRTLI